MPRLPWTTEFESKGAPKLEDDFNRILGATKRLHEETKKLEDQAAFEHLKKGSKPYHDALVATEKATLDASTATLKARTSNKELLESVRRNTEQQKEWNRAVAMTGNVVERTRYHLDDLNNIANVTGVTISGLASSAKQTAEALLDMGRQGERSLALVKGFESLGGSTEDLERLQRATQNLITKDTLMRMSNYAKEMKVTKETFETIAVAAVGASKRTGRDAEKLIEQGVLGVARRSADRLDDLGAKLGSLSSIYKKEADRLNISVKDLTEEQKSLAIEADVVRLLQPQVAAAHMETADAVQRLDVRIANAKSTLDGYVASAFNAAADIPLFGSAIFGSKPQSEVESLAEDYEDISAALAALDNPYMDVSHSQSIMMAGLERGNWLHKEYISDMSEIREKLLKAGFAVHELDLQLTRANMTFTSGVRAARGYHAAIKPFLGDIFDTIKDYNEMYDGGLDFSKMTGDEVNNYGKILEKQNKRTRKSNKDHFQQLKQDTASGIKLLNMQLLEGLDFADKTFGDLLVGNRSLSGRRGGVLGAFGFTEKHTASAMRDLASDLKKGYDDHIQPVFDEWQNRHPIKKLLGLGSAIKDAPFDLAKMIPDGAGEKLERLKDDGLAANEALHENFQLLAKGISDVDTQVNDFRSNFSGEDANRHAEQFLEIYDVITSGAGPVINALEQMVDANASWQDATQAAAHGIAQAVGSGVDIMIKDEKKRAEFKAGIAAAEALLAFGFGEIRAGIMFTLAAVKFGAIAGGGAGITNSRAAAKKEEERERKRREKAGSTTRRSTASAHTARPTRQTTVNNFYQFGSDGPLGHALIEAQNGVARYNSGTSFHHNLTQNQGLGGF